MLLDLKTLEFVSLNPGKLAQIIIPILILYNFVLNPVKTSFPRTIHTCLVDALRLMLIVLTSSMAYIYGLNISYKEINGLNVYMMIFGVKLVLCLFLSMDLNIKIQWANVIGSLLLSVIVWALLSIIYKILCSV